MKGTTLRPAPHPENSTNKIRNRRGQLSIARVDLGGVTYTRRSDNTLVRTNRHHARNILRYFSEKIVMHKISVLAFLITILSYF